MTIYVNNKPLQTAAADVAAVAVNNCVVPRAGWEAHKLREGDKLTIIRVACGG